MKHLIIKQNTNQIETVNSELLDKLTEYIKTSDNLSNIEGRLYCKYAYKDTVDYLLGNKDDGTVRFPNLYITTEGTYVKFEDSNMLPYCISQKWDSDNDGNILVSELQSVTFFRDEHYSYANSQLLAKSKTIYPLMKYLSSNLTEINLTDYCVTWNEIDISRFNNLQILIIKFQNWQTNKTELIGLDKIDTSNITQFSIEGFQKSGDVLAPVITSNKLTNMESAFEGVNKFNTIDLTNVNMSNISNIDDLFANWKYNKYGYDDNNTVLSKIIFPTSFDCSKCTNLYGVFYRNPNLSIIENIDTWNTNNITSVECLFSDTKLSSYDFVFNNWNLKYCTSFCETFSSIKYTGDIILPESWLNIKPNNIRSMFDNTNLNKLDMKNLDMSSPSIRGYNEIVNAFGNPKYLDISGWHLTKLDGLYEFGMSNVLEISMKNFYTPNLKSIRNLFNGCNNMTTLNIELYSNNITNLEAAWGSSLTSLDLHKHTCTCTDGTSFTAWDETAQNCTVVGCFGGSRNLTSINLEGFKVHTAGSIFCLFCDCNKLETIDLSLWDGTITSTFRCFHECFRLKTLDISGFDFDSSLSGEDNLCCFSRDNALTTVYVKDSNAKIFVDNALTCSGLAITSIIKTN